MLYLLFALTLIAGISAGSVSYAAPGSNNGEHNGAAHTNCGEDSTIGQGDGC